MKMKLLLQEMRSILASGFSIRFEARGESMRPLLRPGDGVVISPLREGGPRLGDILLVEIDGRIVLHRLVHRGKPGQPIFVKGDAQLEREGPLSKERVLGLVRERWRQGSRRRMDSLAMRSAGLSLALLWPRLPGPIRAAGKKLLNLVPVRVGLVVGRGQGST